MLQASLWSQLALKWEVEREEWQGVCQARQGLPLKRKDLALHSEQALNYPWDTVLCTA